jgi:hypothetical protein
MFGSVSRVNTMMSILPIWLVKLEQEVMNPIKDRIEDAT